MSTLARLARALAATLIACGCAPARAPAPGTNVVIVLVDQLRKDAADLYLSEVNRLAARGVVIDGMHAAAPWTYPSVISLMSGLYPQQHGANGHPSNNELARFDEAVPLLQERLQAEGYATAAFVTNPYLLEWNAFHLGFDTFDGSFIHSQGSRRGDRRVWVPETMYAASVNDAIRSHFDAAPPTAPEFTYIHYIDAHGPWEGAPFERGYEEAIRYLDGEIVEMYEYFLARYGGDLIFIVTSDHGTAKLSDLELGYGFPWRDKKRSVHEFNLRIPFAVLPSAVVTEARRVSGPASNVDVVPTLLEWLGLSDTVDRPGRSLLPAILRGAPLPRDRPIYARQWAFGRFNDGLVLRGRKYLRFFDRKGRVVKRRIFDLREDSHETQSLGDEFGDVAAVIRRESGDRGFDFEAHFDRVSPEVEKRLRSLGYLTSAEPGG